VTGRSKDQDLIDELLARMQAPDPKTARTNGHASGTVAPPYKGSATSEATTDEAIIEKCRAAENAAKFSNLYDHGDARAHHGGDDSAADLALLGILKFYTQDEGQLERLFSASALGQRSKWRDRSDYRRRTIVRALQGLDEVYDWGRKDGRRLSSSRHSPLVLDQATSWGMDR